MSTAELALEVNEENLAKNVDQKNIFGFWVYIMTDCVLFASLFATYAVLHNNSNGGPGASQLFDLHYVLVETFLLLTSSFTCGLAMLALKRGLQKQVMGFLVLTFALGLGFVVMEVTEFSKFYHQGNSWHRSAFLSSYFTLVGTHGLHVSVGLLWMIVMMVRIAKFGLKGSNIRRLTMLSMFWHFLDLVWIFIYTIVYLLGAVK